MSVERYALDTNIYFYSLDVTSGEKHVRALDLVRRVDPRRSVVLLQTLGELSNSTLKRKPVAFPSATALVMSALPVAVPALPEDMQNALAMRQSFGLQFWDAMLLATALRAGCTTLLSEDMQDNRTYNSITVRNPFTMSPADLQSLLR